MPEMAEESRMTPGEEAAVLAYVLAARQFVPEPAGLKAGGINAGRAATFH